MKKILDEKVIAGKTYREYTLGKDDTDVCMLPWGDMFDQILITVDDKPKYVVGLFCIDYKYDECTGTTIIDLDTIRKNDDCSCERYVCLGQDVGYYITYDVIETVVSIMEKEKSEDEYIVINAKF